MMKTTSSNIASMANAVCNKGEPFSRMLQRARTDDPARLKPSPIPVAAAKLTASGQASSIAETSTATLRTLIKTARNKTRAWPTRSVARPQSGATMAPVTVMAAASDPARPKEPVVSDASSTMPMPVIDSGNRATKPAKLKATARRSDSSCRYAPSPAGMNLLPYARITPVDNHSAGSHDALTNQLEHSLAPYEAVLLVSFGGPEGPEDVMPFLRNVTRGRGIPAERLVAVGRHYLQFGGRSPINDQCRSLLAALTNELLRRGIHIPLYWGNRNWEPYLRDELRAIQQAGYRRVLAVITSAYPSYSSCRQYRENLFDAAQRTQIQIDRIRHYANHPGFVTASVEACLEGLEALGESADHARLVFVTHSIPMAMAETAGPTPRSRSGAYVDWHAAVASEVTHRVGQQRGRSYGSDLVYCSRSGPASQPWLEPDINDQLRQLAARGVSGVVVVPIGFISDHMEVVFDLDTEAAATAKECGIAFARAATAGNHPAFVGGLVDLMLERAAAARGEKPQRPVLGSAGPGWYDCRKDCCPNLRETARPAVCEATD